MKQLQLRFMYVVIRFLAKFMLYGAEGMKDNQSLCNTNFTDELVTLADNLRDEINE